MLREAHKNNLRQRAAQWTTGILKDSFRVGLIGAFYNPHSPTGLYCPDETLFDDIARTLFELGYTLPANFDPHIVNIHENHGGRDYMSAHECEFNVSAFMYVRRVKTKKDVAQSTADHLASSRHELKSHPWLRGAIERKSSVLVTHGGKDDVTSKDFKGGLFFNRSPYKLIHSEPREYRGEQKLLGANLEVLVHKDMQ